MERLTKLKVNEPDYATTFTKLQASSPALATIMRKPESTDQACTFCKDSSHIMRLCPTLREYERAGKVVYKDGFWRLLNGDQSRGHPNGLKSSVDEHYSVQKNATAPTNYFATAISESQDSPPVASFIEEVIDEESEVFAAQPPPKSTTATAPKPAATDKKGPQFQYVSKVEDPTAQKRVVNLVRDAWIQIQVKDLLSVVADVRKEIYEELRVARIPVQMTMDGKKPTAAANSTNPVQMTTNTRLVAKRTLPVWEFDLYIQGKHMVTGIFDTGAALVCISTQAVIEFRLAHTKDISLTMQDANGGSKDTYGMIEDLELTIGGVSIFVQAYIIDDAPYQLLLGRPFQDVGNFDTENAGRTLIMKDPCNNRITRIPTRPHGGDPSRNHLFIVEADGPEEEPDTPQIAPANLLLASHLMSQSAFKYKPVARKVKPVATTMPADAVPKRKFPEDPLLSLKPLMPNPPPIEGFTSWLTEE